MSASLNRSSSVPSIIKPYLSRISFASWRILRGLDSNPPEGVWSMTSNCTNTSNYFDPIYTSLLFLRLLPSMMNADASFFIEALSMKSREYLN